ncbi:STN domain-containing protein [Parabacteroides johnsonii]|uniref:STN domain-containing protein n=1 Tax=Parabacteroides johnsonii TaxID=387661 RepID=UPI00241BF810|nr:carboxypeptidase-like regulatory domain-containing protein [Parabacteroides johnsonii]
MKNVSYYRHLHSESLKKLVAITKITAVSLLTVLPSTMQAESSYSQSAVISVKAERMLLTDLFSQIEKQSEFLFFYVDKDVANIKVNVKANSNQIDEVLTQALAGTGLTYTINDRNINIMRKTYARQQQTKQIKGKVLDSNGDPIIGANVVEKGTTNGSITDIEGLFNISVAPGATLILKDSSISV